MPNDDAEAVRRFAANGFIVHGRDGMTRKKTGIEKRVFDRRHATRSVARERSERLPVNISADLSRLPCKHVIELALTFPCHSVPSVDKIFSVICGAEDETVSVRGAPCSYWLAFFRTHKSSHTCPWSSAFSSRRSAPFDPPIRGIRAIRG